MNETSIVGELYILVNKMDEIEETRRTGGNSVKTRKTPIKTDKIGGCVKPSISQTLARCSFNDRIGAGFIVSLAIVPAECELIGSYQDVSRGLTGNIPLNIFREVRCRLNLCQVVLAQDPDEHVCAFFSLNLMVLDCGRFATGHYELDQTLALPRGFHELI